MPGEDMLDMYCWDGVAFDFAMALFTVEAKAAEPPGKEGVVAATFEAIVGEGAFAVEVKGLTPLVFEVTEGTDKEARKDFLALGLVIVGIVVN